MTSETTLLLKMINLYEDFFVILHFFCNSRTNDSYKLYVQTYKVSLLLELEL